MYFRETVDNLSNYASCNSKALEEPPQHFGIRAIQYPGEYSYQIPLDSEHVRYFLGLWKQRWFEDQVAKAQWVCWSIPERCWTPRLQDKTW